MGCAIIIGVVMNFALKEKSTDNSFGNSNWQNAKTTTAQTTSNQTSTAIYETSKAEIPTAINDGFILIEGGSFNMGSPDSENWRIDDEQLHEVTISSFYIDAYETKQSDYEALLGSDPSTFDGEGLPVDKTVGDSVFCGTINRFGAVDMKATKVGEDSSLKKLIKMVEDAENKQAPTQRIADKWASWLVPVALLIAILAYVITGDIVRGVTVMVVFCPCALVLSTPTAIMAAIGQATKHGVIIKSGEALEIMGKVDTIAFDKTGTLTYGKLEVSEVALFGVMDSDTLLKLTASAEAKSEHPLGKAITNYAKSKNTELFDCDVFRMTAGKGIYAEVGGHRLFCGNEKYLAENGISLTDEVSEKAAQFRNEGKASVLAAENGSIIGIIALSDVLRPEAKEMVSRLSALGTKTVLLTGDHKKTADYFAAKVGISEVRADLLPEEKVANITAL